MPQFIRLTGSSGRILILRASCITAIEERGDKMVDIWLDPNDDPWTVRDPILEIEKAVRAVVGQLYTD